MGYRIDSVIGEGSYGAVWKCYDIEQGAFVAFKKFKAESYGKMMSLAIEEINILGMLDHPHIVKKLNAFHSRSEATYLVMEYVPHNLVQLFKMNPAGLPKNDIKIMMYQLLKATEYMHHKGIMHRDLKPANILLTDDGDIKICDLGFARKMSGSQPRAYSPYISTRWYRAPEVLLGDMYNSSIDVWSLGCLFAEMVTSKALFRGQSTLEQLKMICELRELSPIQRWLMKQSKTLGDLQVSSPVLSLREYFPSMTPTMLELLDACLQMDPAKRLSSTALLDMPYFFDIEAVLTQRKASRKPGGTWATTVSTPALQSLNLSEPLDMRPASNSCCHVVIEPQCENSMGQIGGSMNASNEIAGASVVLIAQAGACGSVEASRLSNSRSEFECNTFRRSGDGCMVPMSSLQDAFTSEGSSVKYVNASCLSETTESSLCHDSNWSSADGRFMLKASSRGPLSSKVLSESQLAPFTNCFADYGVHGCINELSSSRSPSVSQSNRAVKRPARHTVTGTGSDMAVCGKERKFLWLCQTLSHKLGCISTCYQASKEAGSPDTSHASKATSMKHALELVEADGDACNQSDLGVPVADGKTKMFSKSMYASAWHALRHLADTKH